MLEFLIRVLVDRLQHSDVRAVTQAGQLLQCVLGIGGHAAELADQQVYNIIRVILLANSAQIPGPTSLTVIESEYSFIAELGKELDCKKWIPCRPFMYQFCEGASLIRFTMNRIRNKLLDVFPS